MKANWRGGKVDNWGERKEQTCRKGGKKVGEEMQGW